MTIGMIFDLCLYLGVWERFLASAVETECRAAGVPANEGMIQAVIRQRIEAGEIRIVARHTDGTPVYARVDRHTVLAN